MGHFSQAANNNEAVTMRVVEVEVEGVLPLGLPINVWRNNWLKLKAVC